MYLSNILQNEMQCIGTLVDTSSLETLPSELQRNFTLMRDLDNRAQEEMKNIDKLSNEYLQNVANYSAEEKTAKVDQIQSLYKKAQAYADDKVQLAMQTYEMVDKHIRRLDADLARFEADLKDKALNPHSSDSETNSKKKGRKVVEKVEKKKGRRPVSSDDDTSKSGRKKKHTAQPEIATLSTLSMAHPSDVLDMPVDPNEPTYCFCHQVSYGEMIGCDNPDCPIEWFHFACVGLTSKPKGKWYCSQCSAERKKK